MSLCSSACYRTMLRIQRLTPSPTNAQICSHPPLLYTAECKAVALCEIGGYARPISGQRLGNQRSFLGKTYKHAIIEDPCFLCDPFRGTKFRTYFSYEIFAGQKRREHRSWRIFVVKIRYQETTRESKLRRLSGNVIITCSREWCV
jgi:hypothetical protein